MSVVQVKGRTTNVQSEFEEFSLSINSLIYTSASEDNIEDFSIDLTVGSGWNDRYSLMDRGLREIEGSIVVGRHGSIVVEVAEEIRIPHNKYGLLIPTGSLFLSKGLMVAPAKVEPSFTGKLKLRIFNTTSDKVVLKKGDKLGSVFFFRTELTKTCPQIYRLSDISAAKETRFDKLKKWFSVNKIIWIGWIISFSTSSIAAVALTYFLYYKPILLKGS